MARATRGNASLAEARIGKNDVLVPPAEYSFDALRYRQMSDAFDRHSREFQGDPFPSLLEALWYEDLTVPGLH